MILVTGRFEKISHSLSVSSCEISGFSDHPVADANKTNATAITTTFMGSLISTSLPGAPGRSS
jgi:hypothetical protein